MNQSPHANSMRTLSEPSLENDFLADYINTLNNSLEQWIKTDITTAMQQSDAAAMTAQQIYHAPFALLSHGIESDPLINYANLTAQHLFEMNWSEITHLPSRLSAEMVAQEERDVLLKRVSEHGYIDNYSGVRTSKTGQRFMIHQATVWNLLSPDKKAIGQAAMFASWQFCPIERE